jgi:CRISPR-associated protein Cas1
MAMRDVKDFHALPRVSDSWSFLYVEHARIDQHDKAVALWDASGMVPVPCASLEVLMLGPGTAVTHEAMKTLTSHGCTVVWTGEQGVRLYASVVAENRRSRRVQRQARLWASSGARLEVVRRMYEHRFAEPVPPELTLQQLRGLEGIRVRETYARMSRETGVPWAGRSYKAGQHQASDIVNRALSTANSCLYGVCHAAIVAAGYSPALGFIHTGKMLSFVFDVADLYKTEVSIPAAFMAAADGPADLDTKTRKYCRNYFHEARLLARIVDDIDNLLDTGPLQLDLEFGSQSGGLPSGLWDPTAGEVEGGVNYASEQVAKLADDIRQRATEKTAARRSARTRRANPPRRTSGGGARAS